VSEIKPRWPGARARHLKSGALTGHAVREGTFRSFDGTRLFYRVEGPQPDTPDPNRPPLVFCYGLMCSSFHWTYQIDHFRVGYNAVCMDYRAHQNSEVPRDLRSLNTETMAMDLALCLDHLGIDRAVLIGHSMGSNVAMEFYRQHPDRVAGLVLANATARRPLETLFYGNFNQKALEIARFAFDLSPDLVRKGWDIQKKSRLAKLFITLGGFNPFLTSPEDVEVYVREALDADPEVFLTLLENYDRYDATTWLHQIRVPTLLLAGKLDLITPLSNQRLLHQLIPGSQLEIIPNGSHCIQLDLPELINRKLERFLNELAPRSV
jgi:pimeloyl-ACP methyl ester carboxylesterase